MTTAQARIIEGGRLHLGWREVAGAQRLRKIECLVENTSNHTLIVNGFELLCVDGVDLKLPNVVLIGSEQSTRFAFEVQLPAVGVWHLRDLSAWVEGPLGLFASRVSFAIHLRLVAPPRALARRRLSGVNRQREGALSRGRFGDLRFRELRDYVIGDPIRRVAWKASARRGQLLVREMEGGNRGNIWLIVDTGPSMRGGLPGERLIDRAIEDATELAQAGLTARVKVGLLTFDEWVTQEVRLGSGHDQLNRITRALLQETDVFHPLRVGVDEDEAEARVREDLKQKGITLDSRSPEASLRQILVKQNKGKLSWNALEVWYQYCRLNGINLEFRASLRALRDEVFATVLRRATGKEVSSVILLTDMAGVRDPQKLLPQLSHRNQHTSILLYSSEMSEESISGAALATGARLRLDTIERVFASLQTERVVVPTKAPNAL